MRLVALLCALAAFAAAAQDVSIDREDQSRRHDEFRTYLERTRPGYLNLIREQRGRFLALRSKVRERERAGQDTACSSQMLDELDWLTGDAMDFDRVARRLADLEFLLAHPAQEVKARQEDPADGGWGQCHSEWFFKVNATFDHITNPGYAGEMPRYELHLLDRVNSPDKLMRYFDSVSTSDIAATGRDNARELNESLENLGRLILRGRPAYYRWDPHLKEALLDIISNRLRNAETGWWGRRYVRGGSVVFVDA
jgi:hypothetical protein